MTIISALNEIALLILFIYICPYYLLKHNMLLHSALFCHTENICYFTHFRILGASPKRQFFTAY